MQDAVNTSTPGAEGSTFTVHFNRADFSPGDLLQDSRQGLYESAAQSEADHVANMLYMRGLDREPAPPLPSQAEVLSQYWANNQLEAYREAIRQESERAFREQLITNRTRVRAVEEGPQAIANNTPQGLVPDGVVTPMADGTYMRRENGQFVQDESLGRWHNNAPPSAVEQMRPAQEEYNSRMATLQEMWEQARPRLRDESESTNRRPHVRIHPRITEDDEEQLEMMAARLEDFERRQNANRNQQVEGRKKTMEAVKERKSIYKHRFSDAPWFEWLKGREVVVLGAGGIGSWVVFALARIGCTLYVYDMDTIEPHNLGGQMYGRAQVGANKAQAIAQLANEFAGGEAQIEYFGEFNDDCPVGPIVISCFDNMAGRALAFEKWSQALAEDPENAADYLFLDGRLLAEDYQVYGVVSGRLDAYKKTLFSDSEVGEVQCSLKATTHCSMGICSDIVGVLTNFAANRAHGMDARDVPFSIIKSIPFFTYELNYGVDEQPQESRAEADPQPSI